MPASRNWPKQVGKEPWEGWVQTMPREPGSSLPATYQLWRILVAASFYKTHPVCFIDKPGDVIRVNIH